MRRTGTSLSTALLCLGCGGLFAAPLALNHELTGAEATAARALAERVVDRRFPEEIASACDRGAIAFPWLAARAEEPGVRVAALVAARGCIDEADRADLVTVALHALDADDPTVVAAGLQLAEGLVGDEQEGGPLAARLAAFADDPRPEARFAALVALDRRAWGQEPALHRPFLAALSAEEPWLVAEALRRLRFRAAGLPERDAFLSRCRSLTASLEPGLRGGAALALARLAPEDPEVRRSLVVQLGDPHPYPRAAAAEALGELGWTGAIPPLVEVVDDHRIAVFELPPFEGLDGAPHVVRHACSPHERVDDAVLRALVALSAPLGEDRFVARELDPRYLDLDLISAGRDAERWYAAHASEIPTE